MVGTPWFLSSFWHFETLRKCINRLEDKLCRDMSLIFREHLLAELVLKVLTDNENYLAKTCLDGVIDGVIHDGFTIRT